MIYPALTAFYGALLAIVFAGLSAWVIAGRVAMDTLHGDGGNGDLVRRIRSHANFTEYVPFALLLIGLFEAHGGSPVLVRVLLLVLLVARLIHPVGMFAPKNSPRQFACRGGGMIATISVLMISAIALLVSLA